jgi:hypothetical protein
VFKTSERKRDSKERSEYFDPDGRWQDDEIGRGWKSVPVLAAVPPRSAFGLYQAAEKRPSASFLSSFAVAAYVQVCRTTRDVEGPASRHL